MIRYEESWLHPRSRTPSLVTTSMPLPLIVGLALALITYAGCTTSAPRPSLEVPPEYVLGEPVTLHARDLIAGDRYAIHAERTDPWGRRWISTASFQADGLGRIDVARDAPVEGSYSDVDPFGLLWSMQMPAPPGDDWSPPDPLDFSQITYRLSSQGRTLAEVSTRQWIVPPGVRRRRVAGGLVAELFLPATREAAHPTVLLLGGSGGGMGWASRQAGLLAHEGYAALALAYFNEEGLPDHLAQIPLEYVDRALDYLIRQPEIDPDRLGIVGYSKGAELALLIASRREEIRAVVAIAPGSAVFQGFKPPEYPTISSWSLDGQDVEFVPNAYDEKFFETYDGMYLWYRTLGQQERVARAAIPVEQINGDVLMLTGAEDRIWPTTLMAEQVIARLYVADFQHAVKHLPYPEAGHGIAVPPGEPTTVVAERLGGTPAGNAFARKQAWQAIKTFLSRTLASE